MWYRNLDSGGKEFILSLEDIKHFSFSMPMHISGISFYNLKLETSASLEEAAHLVNSARNEKGLPDIDFNFNNILCMPIRTYFD